MEFLPFTDKDFDAYLQNKWSSNVFNRERLEVKQKLLALGRQLSPLMVSGDGALLECEVSAEHPAVWNQRRVPNQTLFFSRAKQARQEIDSIISKKRPMAAMIEDPSPLRNHLFLSVMIDKDQVELGLKLHSDAAVDRENFQRKCQQYFQREKFLMGVNALPDCFQVGIAGEQQLSAPALDDQALEQMLARLGEVESWFQLRHSLSRDDPALRGPEFVELARRELGQLLPLMAFIAWSRENDFLSMRETLKKKEIQQVSRGLAKHDTIRVVKGMFSGKTGVVQEIDAKGAIKVLLGTMAVKLSSEDVSKI